ncbi:MAG: S8 family serine peptidase [Alphaproteobacteria bacterium]|nr:S8 family serine peptidase [Alphaproteobacteria bacterium]
MRVLDGISSQIADSNDLSLIEKERTDASSLYVLDDDNSHLLLGSATTPTSSTQTEFSIEETTVSAKGIPSDPGVISGNFWEQWHHTGANGLNTMPVWDDYTGEGVRVGVIDDGFNYNHSELSNHFRTDLDYDVLDNDNNSINDAGDNHGTNVSQILAGDDNGSRTVGVAFDSELVGIRRGFNGEGDLSDVVDAFQYALDNDFDIINNSWGIDAAFGDNTKINFIGTDTSEIIAKFEELVEFGRDGLGANIVFSAGNDRASGAGANYRNYQNSPYTITVGAISEDGTYADFSDAGANLLVTAAGDDLYVASPNDTNSANIISGTSFSAPAVSGVIALMLEANPDLGYRDVQEILAMSSRQNDAGGTGWAGEGWQFNGATNWNGGGMHFSHDYGYGNVDALAAVRMAETWNIQQTYTNMTTIAPTSSAPALALPDLGTVVTTIDIAQDISIEHVLIDLDISHSRAGDLIVTLTSPDGTDSVLMYRVENGAYTSRYGITGVDFGFSSAAHWGEGSAGTWTLTIEDVAGGNAGTLNDWSLEFLGSAQSSDDLYVYTNEYAGFSGARTTLTDSDGGTDTINAAAVSGNTTIDLNFGGTLAGNIFIIDPGTQIENLYTGDGNDTLTGNAANNILYAGRGDDTIHASLGDDVIDGAQGNDTVSYTFDIGDFLINLIDSVTVALTHVVQAFTDTLSNIENFIFSGTSYTRAELDAYVAGSGQPDPVVDTRLVLGWSGGGKSLTHPDAGDFTYTGDDLGQAGVTDNILNVVRGSTTLSASVLQAGAIDSVILKNDDLTFVNLSGFDSVILDQDNSTNDVTVELVGNNRNVTDTGSGNDVVESYASNGGTVSFINTRAGNDFVYIGGAGTATVYLGEGDDSFAAANTADVAVHGEQGNDYIDSGSGNDRLYGGDGDDEILGGLGDDVIRGDAGADRLNGGFGLDLIYGGVGNDIIDGYDGNDTLFGDDGEDTINGGDGADTLRGGNDNDTLNGGVGRDRVFGDDGDDIINGDSGRDFLRGGNGEDVLDGGSDGDKLYGDAGDDTLYGNSGFDALYGGAGNDTLDGGAQNDRLYGQADNDTLNGGLGDDLLDGGLGHDLLIGDIGNDRAYGGTGNDTVTGGLGNDRLYGNDGNDRLEGGDGTDYLYAGSGIDVLLGGAGADRFYGDAGQDTFGLTDLGTGVDRLYNMTQGEDIINITDLLTGYTHGTDDINDLVQLIDNGNGTTDLRINADGDAGGAYGRAALIYTDLSGSSVDDLVTDGTLVVNQSL